jgi:hypothetical protein
MNVSTTSTLKVGLSGGASLPTTFGYITISKKSGQSPKTLLKSRHVKNRTSVINVMEC